MGNNYAKPTKQGRVLEIEVMKAIAIISMVVVHVFEACKNIDPLPGIQIYTAELIEILGGVLSAGVFCCFKAVWQQKKRGKRCLVLR